jgi:hypothetical protein
MPEEKEHWVTILINSMAAKIIAFTLLGLLAIAVGVGLFTNKHVKILGIEFNGNDTAKISTYHKPDTIFINQNKSESLPSPIMISTKKQPKPITKNRVTDNISDSVKHINQQNVNGDNNLNTGVNNGNIGGQGNTVINERHLTQADEIAMFKMIDSIKEQNHSNKMCFSIFSTTNSNGGKVSNEIYNALIKNGYSMLGNGTSFAQGLNGIVIEFDKSDSCISITVGVL